MNYIYSTLSCSNIYPVYEKQAAGNVTISKDQNGNNREIKINGGANVITKALTTPRGAVTPVSDEDLELLLQNNVFKEQMKNGFITIDKKEKTVEKAVQDMKKKDQIAPLTEDDMKKVKEKKV